MDLVVLSSPAERRPKMAKVDYERIGFGMSLPGDLLDIIDERATKEHRSRINMIEVLVRATLDEENNT